MENQEFNEMTPEVPQECPQPQETKQTLAEQIRSIDKKVIKIGAAVLAAIVVVCLLIAFVPNAVAYANAKSAFENIDEAYNMTNMFSKDIYEAWFEAINNADEVTGASGSYYKSYDYLEGLEYLTEDMYISFEEIKLGVVYAWYGPLEYAEKKDNITDEDVEQAYKGLLGLYNSTFSACVKAVSATYEVTGRADQINALLDGAKKDMKKMSKSHSDYVHYPDLKDYLTLTRAFFDFCTSPEGSFEQVKDTFNNYRNESRSYYFALDYIFE